MNRTGRESPARCTCKKKKKEAKLNFFFFFFPLRGHNQRVDYAGACNSSSALELSSFPHPYYLGTGISFCPGWRHQHPRTPVPSGAVCVHHGHCTSTQSARAATPATTMTQIFASSSVATESSTKWCWPFYGRRRRRRTLDSSPNVTSIS